MIISIIDKYKELPDFDDNETYAFNERNIKGVYFIFYFILPSLLWKSM